MSISNCQWEDANIVLRDPSIAPAARTSRFARVRLCFRASHPKNLPATVSRRGEPWASNPLILRILLILSPSFETGFTGFIGLQDYASSPDQSLSIAEWPFSAPRSLPHIQYRPAALMSQDDRKERAGHSFHSLSERVPKIGKRDTDGSQKKALLSIRIYPCPSVANSSPSKFRHTDLNAPLPQCARRT